MRNFTLNNIVSCYNRICYVNEVTSSTYLGLKGEDFTSLTNPNIIKDIDLSDWFFNQLFESKRSVDTWVIAGCYDTTDEPLYWIKKETEGVYLFQRMIKGRTVCYSIDSVRVFQNLYNFYREYDEWAECLVEIDDRIKEIYFSV